MFVIRHQTIARPGNLLFLGVLPQQVEACHSIPIRIQSFASSAFLPLLADDPAKRGRRPTTDDQRPFWSIANRQQPIAVFGKPGVAPRPSLVYDWRVQAASDDAHSGAPGGNRGQA
jgi:hypothetical protein